MKSILQEIKPVKKSLRTSAEIRDEITSSPTHLRRARTLLLGARQAATEVSAQIINGSIHSPADDLDTPDSGRYMDLGKTLHEGAGLTFFVQALEQDETVIEAMEKLEPLYLEHAQALDRERAEAAAERAAWQERENQKAEALAKATAEIEAQFATS